jgi:anthranilate synthase/aminodeoxychorismate synthase-like glutamine amidotransferase
MEMVAFIDNYDSFTYNLVQAIQEAGFDARVFRNDVFTVEEIEGHRPVAIVISPGPGRPESAGISIQAVRYFAGKIPILGVCLGHQAIVQAFGGTISTSRMVMHGKTSRIHHDGSDLYREIADPFEAVRYHSLIVKHADLPACFRVSAWTHAGEIMGIRHRQYRVEGVQFHPESVLTQQGKRILANFLEMRR